MDIWFSLYYVICVFVYAMLCVCIFECVFTVLVSILYWYMLLELKELTD